MRTAVLIPAWQANETIGGVVESVARFWGETEGGPGVIVVDDGSTDGTAERARQTGALVVEHGRRQGRGAALRTGLRVARDLEVDAVISVDADGRQPGEEVKRIAEYPCDARALVLGVRDLRGMGAPRTSRLSNRISNFLLSVCTGRVLADTQCGLRRYPVRETLALDPRDSGYGFEAEVLLLAVRAGLPVVEVPIQGLSTARPPHYSPVTDPPRIMARVLYTLGRRQPGLIRRSDAHPFGDRFAARN